MVSEAVVYSIGTIAAPIRHFGLVFAAEIKRLVAYRVQFWCELVLSSIIELFVALSVWRAIFEVQASGRVQGYSFHGMVLYTTAAIFVGQAVRGTNIGTFARDIYDGSFTKYLVYPLSVYSYKLGTFMPRTLFALAQLALALLGLKMLAIWPAGVGGDIGSWIAALGAVILAAVLYFLLLFSIEAIGFWADNVWALSVMLQAAMVLLSGKLIPIDLFPVWLRGMLAWLPFPYLVYFPCKVFLGELSAQTVAEGYAVLLLWIAFAFVLSRIVYRRGLTHYTGVGM